MSLHTLANHLQSAGRGEDKVLVHMTPGEVQGLQSLAMAHGGSLTINPETGLPEAGILSSLLPIVAGAFLGPAGLGLSAMQTGLAVGALGTAATGSLGKGLMMGFGAYGGAGLGEGLMNAGAETLGNGLGEFGSTAGQGTGADYAKFLSDTGQTATSNMPAVAEATNAAGTATTNLGGLNAYSAPKPFEGVNFSNYQNPVTQQYALPQADASKLLQNTEGAFDRALNLPKDVNAATTLDASGKFVSPQNTTPVSEYTGQNWTSSRYGAPEGTGGATYQTGKYIPPASNLDKVSAGIKDVTSSGDKAWSFVKEHPAPFIGVGMGALQEYQEQKAKDAAAAAGSGSPGMIRPYEYSVAQNQSAYAPNASTAERNYFYEPRFIPKEPYAAKEGGVMSLAVGGAVENMSAQNAIGGNMMYPQSQLQTTMYSNPMVQRPMPNNVINAGVDAPVDPYTGEAKFAAGGDVSGSGNLNLNIPLNFNGGNSGGSSGNVNGYSAVGSGNSGTTDSTSSTQLLPPAAQASSAPAPQGHTYMPEIKWREGSVLQGFGGTGPLYTSGDPQADAWVKSQQNSVLSKTGTDAIGNHKPEIENLYRQYYQGYAKGGLTSLASGGVAHYEIGGVAAAKPAEPTTDVKYAFDPATQQFTQTTTSTPAAQGSPFDMFGIGRTMMGGMVPGSNISNGAYFGLTPALIQRFGGQQAPQPTVTTETSGGISAPAMQAQPQTEPMNPIVPNINIPQPQNVNQQLGLESFYPMMEQKLAAKGAQVQGMASGGIARFGDGGTPASAKNPNAKPSGKAPATWLSYLPQYAETSPSPSALPEKSAASTAPAYTYNPQNLQFTDQAGNVSVGMQPQFIPVQPIMPDQQMGMTGYQGYARGGDVYSLGGYSDGGRLLKGPGDGVSDSIPATVGHRQPARLADGEFVVPARIVSEIGNGSTEAGARKLYAMMDRVQKARGRTVGKNKVAVNTKSDKYLPA